MRGRHGGLWSSLVVLLYDWVLGICRDRFEEVVGVYRYLVGKDPNSVLRERDRGWDKPRHIAPDFMSIISNPKGD